MSTSKYLKINNKVQVYKVINRPFKLRYLHRQNKGKRVLMSIQRTLHSVLRRFQQWKRCHKLKTIWTTILTSNTPLRYTKRILNNLLQRHREAEVSNIINIWVQQKWKIFNFIKLIEGRYKTNELKINCVTKYKSIYLTASKWNQYYCVRWFG